MRFFKLLIVSSSAVVIALALSAVNTTGQLSGQSGCRVSVATPSYSDGKQILPRCLADGSIVVGGVTLGDVTIEGGGDASASNQTTQIGLETHIATSAVAIATHANAMREVLPRIATSTVALVPFVDGLEGLITSGNAILTPIATSVVAVATGVHAMSQVHSAIATSVVKLAQQGLSLDTAVATSLVAIATGTNRMQEVHPHIATSVVKLAQQGLSLDTAVATSLVAIATNTWAIREVEPRIATSAVAMVGYVDGLEGLITSGNAILTPIATSVVAVATGTHANNGLLTNIATHANSMREVHPRIATAAVSVATSTHAMSQVLPSVATSIVALTDRFPERQQACHLTVAMATSAVNFRQVIPQSAGKEILVCSELWTVTQAALVSFGYGNGTNCESGATALTGEMSIAASSGAARGAGLGTIYRTPVDKAFCVRIATASGGAAIGGTLHYYYK
jgi:hypothetical protein